jgi:asparagine synthase (glutamine-hydrolysing)
MAARVGGRHEVVPIRDRDLLGALPGLLDAMDQPTADGVNTYVVARAAADRGIKVLLSGVGGDELFGGYTTFRKAPLLAAHAGWLAPLSGLALRLGLGRSGPWEKLSAAGAVTGLRDAYLLQRSIGMAAAGAADAGYGLSRPASEQLRIPVGASAFHAVSWLETSFYLRNQLLRDADVMSAAHSIEVRVPFVDREVLRAAWAVPADMHMGRLTGRKRVLRAVLERWHGGRVGRGPKRGFVFPWRAWMQGPLGKQMAATLGDRGGLEALGLPPELGVRALAACGRGASDVPWMQPWSLFALLEWNRRVGLAA